MRKNHTSKTRNSHQVQDQKGRVLARELSEELEYVRGGSYTSATFTQTPEPDGLPDWD